MIDRNRRDARTTSEQKGSRCCRLSSSTRLAALQRKRDTHTHENTKRTKVQAQPNKESSLAANCSLDLLSVLRAREKESKGARKNQQNQGKKPRIFFNHYILCLFFHLGSVITRLPPSFPKGQEGRGQKRARLAPFFPCLFLNKSLRQRQSYHTYRHTHTYIDQVTLTPSLPLFPRHTRRAHDTG